MVHLIKAPKLSSLRMKQTHKQASIASQAKMCAKLKQAAKQAIKQAAKQAHGQWEKKE